MSMGNTQILIAECKGLLDAARRKISDAKYDLASDNIGDLAKQTREIREILDHIDEKVRPYVSLINDDDWV